MHTVYVYGMIYYQIVHMLMQILYSVTFELHYCDIFVENKFKSNKTNISEFLGEFTV